MWLVALAACHWTPNETGRGGMVGQLVDASGTPIVDVAIETLEAAVRTDETGRFAVTYKAPNTEVHFVRGLVFYQRRWLPSDDAEVALRLPATRRAELTCGDRACDVTLTWALAEGFEARVAGRCASGAARDLGEIPVGTPAISCRDGVGQPESPVTLEDRGDFLVVVPPPSVLVIRIASAGAAPRGCVASVDGKPAPIAPDGSFTVSGYGLVQASAICDERPARPVVVDTASGEVSLEWSAEGPLVRLPPGEVDVQCRGTQGGWRATWRVDPNGILWLPPLEAGMCEIVSVPSDQRSEAWAAEAPAALRPGILTLRAIGQTGYKGWLKLEDAVLSGEIPVRR